MSIIKHVTLQKIVAHDFRYDPLTCTACLVNDITFTVVESAFVPFTHREDVLIQPKHVAYRGFEKNYVVG